VPSHPLRILLVEDHHATAGALAKMLTRYGFTVTSAGSAESALEAVEREKRFDLLITDVGLPGKSGWQLFLDLKNKLPRLVAITLTGYGRPEDVEQSKKAGIHVHLTKPIRMVMLQEAILRLFPEQEAVFTDAQGRMKPL
jgi:two-component system CheB/CheR fusion protein